MARKKSSPRRHVKPAVDRASPAGPSEAATGTRKTPPEPPVNAACNGGHVAPEAAPKTHPKNSSTAENEREELKRHLLERAKGHVVLCQLIKTFGDTDPAFVLFLGAGASDSSGIPTAGKMVHEWQKDLFREREGGDAEQNPAEFEAWRATGYPLWKRQTSLTPQFGSVLDYPLLFSHFYSERGSRQRYMEEVMSEKIPTIGYLYLAGLIKGGYFNRVLTTNFDELVADALFRYYSVRAYSLAFDSALTSIRLDSPRPKIFKLHGDFLYDNIRNLRQELARLDVLMEEKMYRICAESGLIVIGYGGNDVSVIGPIRDMLRRGDYLKLGLHWCLQKPPGGEDPYIPDLVLNLAKEYPDRIHFYLIRGFDELIEDIFVACGVEMSTRLTDPLTDNLVHDLITATNRHGMAIKTSTTNRYLSSFGSNLLQSGRTFKTLLTQADLRWRGARDAQRMKAYPEALEFFQGALEMLMLALDKPDAQTASLADRVLCEGRATGICLGAAEEAHRARLEGWASHLDRFWEHTKRAMALEREAGYGRLAVNDRTRAVFNSIPALGLSVLGGLREKQEVRGEVAALLRRLQPMDPGGGLLRELRDPREEPSCQPIVDLLPATWAEFRP